MKTIELSDNDFESSVIKSEKPVLVDFGAEWCPPCRAMDRVIEQISADFDGKVVVGKLNVDENPMTTSTYGVRNLPTFLIFRKGALVDRVVGAVPKSVLTNKLQALL
jgi:thioredoxin 1